MILYIYLIHSKNENSNISRSGTAVLLKVDTLHQLENYIRLIYCSVYPLTLYFQMQFIKVDCTINARSVIIFLFHLKSSFLSQDI